MKKMTTLYKKNPKNLGRVINEINPENDWVFEKGIPTRKFDGTSCMIKNGEIYRRYNAKNGKTPPEGAIPCCDSDKITGHWPHWVKCNINDKYHLEAFKGNEEDGTYELCGEKIQSNPEKIKGHRLIPHGREVVDIGDFSFDSLNSFFNSGIDIEGIVFHEKGGDRMCKIRLSDFGIKRQ